MSYFSNITVNNIRSDKFGMLNVASPTTLFDAQFTNDLHPLLYEQVLGSGGSIVHDTTNRCADINVNTAASTSTYMQTFEYFRYQPGKAQRVYMTFNFKGVGANATKFAQYGDSTNAFRVELRPDGTAWARIITSTSEGNKQVQITNSNIDWTKEQILIIEFEALYVGSVGFTLQLEGDLILVADIKNSNNSNFPYIATANLPIRVGIDTNGSGTANTDMLFNCVSVQSSGGIDSTIGYPHSVQNNITASSGTRTFALAVRPKLLFNGFTNRVKFVDVEIEIIVTGSNAVDWDLSIGQAITGASYTDVNTTYSAFESSSAGTISGSPAYIFDRGTIPASSQTKGNVIKKILSRLPITLDAAGLQRSLGTITLTVNGIGGSSAVRTILKWTEVR